MISLEYLICTHRLGFTFTPAPYEYVTRFRLVLNAINHSIKHQSKSSNIFIYISYFMWLCLMTYLDLYEYNVTWFRLVLNAIIHSIKHQSKSSNII
jgi:hypothetical protein